MVSSLLLTLLRIEDSGFTLQLLAKVPVGSIPATAGIDTTLAWKGESGGGFYRSREKRKELYTVHFEAVECKLKEEQSGNRGREDEEETEEEAEANSNVAYSYGCVWEIYLFSRRLTICDRLEKAELPWGPLDDDGEEVLSAVGSSLLCVVASLLT